MQKDPQRPTVHLETLDPYSFLNNAANTVCVKRNAHLISNFFVAPLGEGGQKLTWSIM